MSPDTVTTYFTRSDGSYQFARWGRSIAPVVFGTDDASLSIIKTAITEVASLGDVQIAEADPELGSNLLVFFVPKWADLRDVPNLDRLIPDLDQLLDRLEQAGANQYRSFCFDEDGAIKFCAILLRYDDQLAQVSAHTLATAQMVQSMLLWSDTAFREESPVAMVTDSGTCIAKPAIAALIRAAYDPVLPVATQDTAHAHRLAARAGLLLGDLGT